MFQYAFNARAVAHNDTVTNNRGQCLCNSDEFYMHSSECRANAGSTTECVGGVGGGKIKRNNVLDTQQASLMKKRYSSLCGLTQFQVFDCFLLLH